MSRALSWSVCLALGLGLAGRASAAQVQLAPGNGLWLKPSATPVVGNEAALLANIQARALKHVFLWTITNTSAQYASYTPFLQQAHANGLTVHAVCATKTSVSVGDTPSAALLSNALQAVIDYNTTHPAAAFDGVQIDIEGVSGPSLLALVSAVQVPDTLVFSAAVQTDDFYGNMEGSYGRLLQNTDLDLLIPMLYIMDGMSYSTGAPGFTFTLSRLRTRTAALLSLLPAQGRMLSGLSAYDRQWPLAKANTNIDRAYLESLGAPDGWSQPAFSTSTGSSKSVPNLVAAGNALVDVFYLTNTGTSIYRFDYDADRWLDVVETTPIGLRRSVSAANLGGLGDSRYLGTCTWLYHTVLDGYSGREEGLGTADSSYPNPVVNVQVLSFQGEVARLRVSLTNANPSERVLGAHAAAGVHLRLEGAVFLTARKGTFHGAEAFDASGNVLANLEGAQIIELRRSFFEDPASQQALSGDIRVLARTPFTLRYRAWMTDKDSLCNDAGTEEPYIARSPNDAHYSNPARFLTYATFSTNVAPFPAGDYAATVLADNPVTYHRFSETGVVTFPNAFVAANLGTVGAAANGTAATADASGSIATAQPGALADPANRALRFSGTGTNRVVVPYRPEWNINGPFTVELWLKGGTGFSCPAASADPVPEVARGWLFYQGDSSQNNGNGWWFRVYRSGRYQVNAQANMTVNPNAWYHVVGVYDGTKALLYVNGALAASTTLSSAYAPNTNTTFQLHLGARSNGGAYAYGGLIDEPAFYTNALSLSQIAAHYGAAATNATGYAAHVLAHHPAGYWRFNDLFNPPVARNSSSNGPLADGLYLHWSSTVPDLQAPAWAGLDPTNRALQLFGTNGQVQLPPLNLAVDTATFECWLKRNGGQPSEAGLILHRNPDASGACGLGFHGAGNHLGYRWNDDPNTCNWDSGLLVPDGQWVYAALAVGPSQAVLCLCDGTNWSTATNASSHAPQAFAGLTRLGTDGGAGRWFNGSLDEAALYDCTLLDSQLRCHALAGFGNTGQLLFTQPPLSQTVQLGAAASFSAATVSATPVQYQWQKDGAGVAGATNLSLTIPNADYADAGQYRLAATNRSGGLLSVPATLIVLPPPSVTNLTYRVSSTPSGLSLELIWPAGSLYGATNLAGPWTLVSNAAPPYFKVAIEPATPHQFFRVQ